MSDRLLSFLSREWSALAIGAPLLLVGAIAASRGLSMLGGILLIMGLLLCIGSLIHLARLAAVRRRLPPPGRLIDIGGARIHLVAEGETNGHWPIVWFGGGHSAGLVMDHLHRVLRTETRSILMDRPGTGWSDTGSFPRRTVEEVDEIVRALERSGEAGPFVFAGHSYGGLLAANIARRYPQLVARLVLLDATPLDTIVYGPHLGALGEMRREALLSALLRLVGFKANLTARRIKKQAQYAQGNSQFEDVLGPALGTLRAVDVSAGSQFATYSSFLDLAGPSIAERGWEMSAYDGDLGDLSLWLVAPGNAEEVKGEREVADSKGSEQERMLRFFASSRERYMSASSNARRVVTPPGTTHQFVYERPDFVIDLMKHAVRREG